MRLLLAANNQATRRRKHKKLPSISFNWVQAATNMHPACPNKKQNHLQNSLLRRTQFWVRKSFSKPASLKRASLVALPVAISHKASLKPKRCASATWIQKTSKNEPKHGPKNGTAWRSYFWDRMHSLVKEQKKSTFTVPFLGPSGGTKNETAKSQNQQQRPPTNKKWQLRLVKQQAYRVGTEEARTCEAWFQLTFRPQKWNLKAHMWYQLSMFPSFNAAIAMQHHPGNIHQSVATPRLLRYSVVCFNSITQCNWHDIETMAE